VRESRSWSVARTAVRVLVAIGAAAFAALVYVYLTLPDVRSLATVNPRSTAFMELRAREAARDGRRLRHVHTWVSYCRISPSLRRAVLVAEDSVFWEHEGVDVEQIRESIQATWEQGRAIRGASTITQQLAKNLYLSPSRDPLRKLRELIIARRFEAALPKERIFEIYLNVIEWGEGIWGVEAAAQTYFGLPASALDARQAALLAGAIINPRAMNPARPTARLLRRQQIILGRMGQVAPPPPPNVVAASPEPAGGEAEPFLVEALSAGEAPRGVEPSAEEVPAADVPDPPTLPGESAPPRPKPFPEPTPGPAPASPPE
jgi:monofunctional biosynthetic peptidoglycan transglycosylase